MTVTLINLLLNINMKMNDFGLKVPIIFVFIIDFFIILHL